mmetsp:Transcript_13919/g.34378  ORF Transcript_13919/g.34378 Transcript_13919/m.34378 type:complete len:649 (+) Transcript_13919:103-2049(+)
MGLCKSCLKRTGITGPVDPKAEALAKYLVRGGDAAAVAAKVKGGTAAAIINDLPEAVKDAIAEGGRGDVIFKNTQQLFVDGEGGQCPQNIGEYLAEDDHLKGALNGMKKTSSFKMAKFGAKKDRHGSDVEDDVVDKASGMDHKSQATSCISQINADTGGSGGGGAKGGKKGEKEPPPEAPSNFGKRSSASTSTSASTSSAAAASSVQIRGDGSTPAESSTNRKGKRNHRHREHDRAFHHHRKGHSHSKSHDHHRGVEKSRGRREKMLRREENVDRSEKVPHVSSTDHTGGRHKETKIRHARHSGHDHHAQKSRSTPTSGASSAEPKDSSSTESETSSASSKSDEEDEPHRQLGQADRHRQEHDHDDENRQDKARLSVLPLVDWKRLASNHPLAAQRLSAFWLAVEPATWYLCVGGGGVFLGVFVAWWMFRGRKVSLLASWRKTFWAALRRGNIFATSSSSASAALAATTTVPGASAMSRTSLKATERQGQRSPAAREHPFPTPLPLLKVPRKKKKKTASGSHGNAASPSKPSRHTNIRAGTTATFHSSCNLFSATSGVPQEAVPQQAALQQLQAEHEQKQHVWEQEEEEQHQRENECQYLYQSSVPESFADGDEGRLESESCGSKNFVADEEQDWPDYGTLPSSNPTH